MGKACNVVFMRAEAFINVILKRKVVAALGERERKTYPKREEVEKLNDSLGKLKKDTLHL